MIKLSLILFLIASFLYFFYPESDEEDRITACLVSEEDMTHSCFLRCQEFGDHWRGCCVPNLLDNIKESLISEDFGRCACCQRDYSKNRDFCSILSQGECPTLYDQSMCFYMEIGSNKKRYCDANKTEMQRSSLEKGNGTKGNVEKFYYRRRKMKVRKRLNVL